MGVNVSNSYKWRRERRFFFSYLSKIIVSLSLSASLYYIHYFLYVLSIIRSQLSVQVDGWNSAIVFNRMNRNFFCVIIMITTCKYTSVRCALGAKTFGKSRVEKRSNFSIIARMILYIKKHWRFYPHKTY